MRLTLSVVVSISKSESAMDSFDWTMRFVSSGSRIDFDVRFATRVDTEMRLKR